MRTGWLFAWVALLAASPAGAEVARSFVTLPSSNGMTAVMADVSSGKVLHFRERLPATEEPQLDGAGNEVWAGNQPLVIKSRDLLFDAFFGLRVAGQQRWLPSVPVEVAGSGYEAAGASRGGSGMVTWSQRLEGLTATTWVFAPRDLPHAGFAMVLRVKNAGTAPAAGVSAFSLQNFHLGFGRPGVMAETGSNGETLVFEASREVLERGFAGVVVSRPLGQVKHAQGWSNGSLAAQNGFEIVQNGSAVDLGDSTGELAVGDDCASAFQFTMGTLAPGGEAWAGVVVAHSGDPFAGAQVRAWLEAWVSGRNPKQLVEDERAGWAQFQGSLWVPQGLSADEEAVFRQSAALLAMAQVREQEAFLRQWLGKDGELRFTRFPAADGGTALLPGTIRHRGRGAVLASLPPGEWTYAWVRDGAYAAAALSALGLKAQAREALGFFLDAEGGRFQQWNELRPYDFPPYLVSLTRYLGFGVEETDFNDFGPNLELDGFGLVLWALREHERRTGDTGLADEKWGVISARIADPLVALIDPATGLLRKDSSIWETHWKGRERSWTYSNITAARGLCDAAALAERLGDSGRAARYLQAGTALRAAIAGKLTDGSGALASNLEELQSGEGYLDAAVLEAIALGLFRPEGRIARATLAAMDRLRVGEGRGWARNDDRSDHPGAADLSPWGSDYDSAEWVFTDLRGAIASRGSDPGRAEQLLGWTTSQAVANAGIVPETYDELTGAWKFNAPMIGFGAGAYVLALMERAGGPPEPACGEYFDEASPDAGVADGGVGEDGGQAPSPAPSGCGGCASGGELFPMAALLFLLSRWLAPARQRSGGSGRRPSCREAAGEPWQGS